MEGGPDEVVGLPSDAEVKDLLEPIPAVEWPAVESFPRT